jgi:hypothetical protein
MVIESPARIAPLEDVEKLAIMDFGPRESPPPSKAVLPGIDGVHEPIFATVAYDTPKSGAMSCEVLKLKVTIVPADGCGARPEVIVILASELPEIVQGRPGNVCQGKIIVRSLPEASTYTEAREQSPIHPLDLVLLRINEGVEDAVHTALLAITETKSPAAMPPVAEVRKTSSIVLGVAPERRVSTTTLASRRFVLVVNAICAGLDNERIQYTVVESRGTGTLVTTATFVAPL